MTDSLQIQTADNRQTEWTLQSPQQQLGADANAPNPLGLAERVEN